ncbi:MAG: PEP-CTERM sorting domain-containing protein, partial [Bryobacteraceae bacterium]
VLTGGENFGNGKVDIELVQAPVPEPASCLLFGTLLVGICAGLRRFTPRGAADSVNSNSNPGQEGQ